MLKLADMGKKLLWNLNHKRKLNNTQRDRYSNAYLAYELGNIYGSKTSFSSDTFSLGYMFEHLYPSSSIFEILTSKMHVRDPKKRVTILYV